MPKIDIASMDWQGGTDLPAPLASIVDGRTRKRLGDAVGLTQYGVNLTKLEPGSRSALRHWHENEDELVFVLTGEMVLVEDDCETILHAGDAAGWKAGVKNGHQLLNRSNTPATYIEIGTRAAHERAHYPDDDLQYDSQAGFTHKDGRPYQETSK